MRFIGFFKIKGSYKLSSKINFNDVVITDCTFTSLDHVQDCIIKYFKEISSCRCGICNDQFNGFIAIDTLHVNGELTQGENIADIGGLTMAYYAYQKSLNGKIKSLNLIMLVISLSNFINNSKY